MSPQRTGMNCLFLAAKASSVTLPDPARKLETQISIHSGLHRASNLIRTSLSNIQSVPSVNYLYPHLVPVQAH
jgi:hypothetical protein